VSQKGRGKDVVRERMQNRTKRDAQARFCLKINSERTMRKNTLSENKNTHKKF
jgi:hypothetical protein